MGNPPAERRGFAIFFICVQGVIVTGYASKMDNIRLGDSAPLANVCLTDVELFKSEARVVGRA